MLACGDMEDECYVLALILVSIGSANGLVHGGT